MSSQIRWRLIQGAFLLYLIAAFKVQAQIDTYVPRFQPITTENGLINGTVFCIYHDATGFIWIGTAAGLDRYDGSNFIHYTNDPSDSSSLSFNLVQDVFQDSKKRIWVSTRNGLNVYNPQFDNFTRFHSEGKGKYFIPNNDIWKVREDKSENLWICTRLDGLVKFNPETGMKHWYVANLSDTNSLYGNRVNDICEDVNGTIWVLTPVYTKSYINLYDRVLDCFHPVPLRIAADNPFVLCGDTSQTLWLGMVHSGLVRFSLNDRSTLMYSHQSTNRIVRAIMPDKENNLWCATDSGLFCFNKETKEFVGYSKESAHMRGFLNSMVWRLTQDKQGNIWAGTWGSGVNYFYPHQSQFNQDYIADEIDRTDAILVDSKDRLWIGTFNSGVFIVERAAKKKHHLTQTSQYPFPVVGGFVRAFAEDSSGHVWIGTTNTLIRIDISYHHVVTTNIDGNRAVNAMIVDKYNHIWIGTHQGLRVIDQNASTIKDYFYNPDNPFSLPHNNILSLYIDSQGRLWIGTNGGGVARYDEKNDQFIDYGHLNHANSMTGSVVYSIREDKYKNIWMGTADGLSVLSEQSHSFRLWTKKDGLPDNGVESLQFDDDDNLWIGTDNGLSRFNSRDSTFTNFFVPNGLTSNSFTTNTSFKGSDGKLYFGCEGGYISFFPKKILTPGVAPRVTLTDFKVFGNHYHLQQSASGTASITLPYEMDFFTFYFSVLDYTYPARNHYKYKLVGINSEWVDAGNDSKAEYTNVPPGEYTFQVLGANSYNLWSTTPLELKVTIVPPFWLTWWFKVLIGIGIIAFFTSLYKYRINHLVEQDRIRIRIAEDLHDEIGGNLSSIAVTSQRLQRLVRLKKEQQEQLQEITAAAFETADAIRDIVWFINPDHDDAALVIKKMTDVVSTLLPDTSTTLNLDMNAIKVIKNLEVRRNIYLVFKEALTNIVRHALASKVCISLTTENSTIILCIEDNGKGFDLSKINYGSGLTNIHRRAKQIKGIIHIDSSIGNGTKILLEYKYHERGMASH